MEAFGPEVGMSEKIVELIHLTVAAAWCVKSLVVALEWDPSEEAQLDAGAPQTDAPLHKLVPQMVEPHVVPCCVPDLAQADGEHKRRLLRTEAASLGGTQNKLSRQIKMKTWCQKFWNIPTRHLESHNSSSSVVS